MTQQTSQARDSSERLEDNAIIRNYRVASASTGNYLILFPLLEYHPRLSLPLSHFLHSTWPLFCDATQYVLLNTPCAVLPEMTFCNLSRVCVCDVGTNSLRNQLIVFCFARLHRNLINLNLLGKYNMH